MSNLSIELLTSPGQVQPHQECWNQLAGNRTQLRWEWLGSWAEHYCREKQLMVLVVRDGQQIIAFTPWHIDQAQFSGRTIRFLGDGKACTDHMTLLITEGREDEVVGAIADWLTGERDGQSTQSSWSHMELIGVDSDDAIMEMFAEKMVERGSRMGQREGLACYGIELPGSMDEYIKRRSKSGKRECRKIRDWLNDERFEVITPQTVSELEEKWFEFVDLHTMRRSASGEVGCFEHVPFGEFLWDASRRLLEKGLLRLTFVQCDGQPISVQHALVSDDRWMYYQSGMDVSYGEFKPGQLALYHTIQQSIDEGKTYFDMMRGDESYKLRWRAEAVTTTEIRIAAPKRIAIIQHQASQWRNAIKSWAKQTVGSK